MRHLTSFSSHLLRVSGELGSGKSTVLRHYIDTDFNQKSIKIDAQICHDDIAVRTKILQQVSYDCCFNAQVSLLDGLSTLINQVDHELTICIDNAEYLSAIIIAEFVQLIEWRLKIKFS